MIKKTVLAELIIVLLFIISCNPAEENGMENILQEKPEYDLVAEDKVEESKGESFPQKFRTEANKIVDENDQVAVFRGLAVIDPIMQALGNDPDFGEFSESQFEEMHNWGADIIRIPILPVSWRRFGQEKSLGVIDQAIGWAAKYEMYVYIDFHSIGFPPEDKYESLDDEVFGQFYQTSQEEIEHFWDIISNRYKDNKVVAFYELFNEPFATDGPATLEEWIEWKAYSEKIIDIIRNNDPDSVVVVGGLDHGYDLFYALENPVDRENIIYASHPYPDKTKWGRSWEDAFGKVSEKYPVFATEFGFDSRSGYEGGESEYPGPDRYRDEIMDYLQNKEISWTAWVFSANWEPSLLENYYTPNEAGLFFKEKLTTES